MKSHTNIAALSVLVLGLSVGTIRAEEAQHVVLQIDDFPGLNTAQGAGDPQWIELLAFSDGLASSVDLASGLPAGAPLPSQIVIKKRVGPSTPLFYQAVAERETIPQATFHFYTSGSRSFETFYTVTLNTVTVSSVRTTYEKGVGLVQEIKLTYETIDWQYNGAGGSTSASYQWF